MYFYCYVYVFLFYVYVLLLLCMICSFYFVSLRCVLFHGGVLCTVCVQMCTVQLPPGFNPIAVSKYIYLYLTE